MKYARFVLAAGLMAYGFSLIAKQPRISNSLRDGIKADQQTIRVALAMREQGWQYIMPSPKNRQAAWGNKDGSTPWYAGYWHNSKTNENSAARPQSEDGQYFGDGAGAPAWRLGGSPSAPTKLEWLLSKSGGIKPQE